VFELIENYVAENSDINPDKILIGGCSAGGYMTMAMLFTHPDYFAAAFPISEAYYSQYVTDEEIERIKDCSIWFTNAKNDTINPDLATNALIERLEAAGASDIHHSEFEDVHDTSGRFTEEDGSAYQYNGHWSWIYFDNNECEENGVNEWEWLASKVQ
jgi:predicted peptidase